MRMHQPWRSRRKSGRCLGRIHIGMLSMSLGVFSLCTSHCLSDAFHLLQSFEMQVCSKVPQLVPMDSTLSEVPTDSRPCSPTQARHSYF